MRIDTGVRAGDEITPYYDPMIAKLIVWGEDRAQAIARMQEALAEVHIVGVANNVDFLARLFANASFARGELDTGLIERERERLFAHDAHDERVGNELLAFACARVLADEARHESTDPWSSTLGWRLNTTYTRTLTFKSERGVHDVELEYARVGYRFHHAGAHAPLAIAGIDGSRLAIAFGGRSLRADVVRQGDELHVFTHGRHRVLTLVDIIAQSGDHEAGVGKLTAPMPGKVIALSATTGARVTRGTPLLVMEAMKMEHTIVAPADGVVAGAAVCRRRPGGRGRRTRSLRIGVGEARPGAVPMTLRIVFCARETTAHVWAEALRAALVREHVDADVWSRDAGQAVADAHAPQADVAVVWRPPAVLFEEQRHLQAVFNLGAGVDALLALPGLPTQVSVFRLEDAGMARALSEYVLAAVLRVYRRFDRYATAQSQHCWQPESPPARDRYDVGVLGLGVLGTAIATTLSGHGFAVRGHARTRKNIAGVDCRAGDAEFASFLDGLDVLVSVLPATPATQGILDQRALARLAGGAHVVNVGPRRGPGRGRPAGAARFRAPRRCDAGRVCDRTAACRSPVLGTA